MKNSHCFSALAPFQFFLIVFLSFLLSFTTITASAQTPSVFREVHQAEWELKNLRPMEPTGASDQLNWNRTRQDFLRLQITSEELQLFARSEEAPDYKKLRAKVGELEKLAERLKRHLPLPRLKETVIVSEDELPLSAVITELDRLVIRFAANPFFKRQQIFDTRDGATSSNDLASILAACESLKKRVEKLVR